jgi:hypothetical protein
MCSDGPQAAAKRGIKKGRLANAAGRPSEIPCILD